MRKLLPARVLAALRPDVTGRFELPAELTRDARRRVRAAAAIGVTAYAVFLALETTGILGGSPRERAIDLVHDGLGLWICGALLMVATPPSIPDRIVLAIALAAEMLLSVVISVAVPWAAFLRTGHVPHLTWVAPVMILFPMLVPARPWTALWVSVACAVTMPAGLVVLDAFRAVDAGWSDVVASLVTGLVAAGIATMGARTLHGAGRQLSAARALGSYELLEPLGHGGMGEVWRARHALLARPAAVKLILAERLQGRAEQREHAVQRFTREAQVTARLRSPHTVELFDFGVAQDGTLYYAMELLDGLNAEHFVYRFGPIPPRRAVHWLAQACHSLGEAHALGLVHRDIKPANLFLCRFGRDCDFVKVLDFGLTKPMHDEAAERLTAPGRGPGTPAWMAPEQAFGVADSRSDLYALGCVGYFLLCGERPFEDVDAAELLRQHLQVEPVALQSRARQFVPPRLEAVIMSCLAKRPEARPAGADALCAALGQCVDGEPWTAEEARNWWDANLRAT